MIAIIEWCVYNLLNEWVYDAFINLYNDAFFMIAMIFNVVHFLSIFYDL